MKEDDADQKGSEASDNHPGDQPIRSAPTQESNEAKQDECEADQGTVRRKATGHRKELSKEREESGVEGVGVCKEPGIEDNRVKPCEVYEGPRQR